MTREFVRSQNSRLVDVVCRHVTDFDPLIPYLIINPHRLTGASAGFCPGTLDAEIVKEVVVHSIKAADRFYPAFLLLLQKNNFESALELFKSSSNMVQ